MYDDGVEATIHPNQDSDFNLECIHERTETAGKVSDNCSSFPSSQASGPLSLSRCEFMF